MFNKPLQVSEALNYLVVGIFLFSFFLQLWYWWGVFGKLCFYKKKNNTTNTPPVSLIICAKNEDHNLSQFLVSVLKQDYPDYEVLVVNDCSYDNTGEVLKEFAVKYKHLKIVTIKEDDYYKHGKKFALMCGIKGAAHEYLVLTDADCEPASDQWLKEMMSNYDDQTAIVLGYGGYFNEKGFLNKLIRFDTFYVALQYLSFALNKKPYMGVGRNLSYKKSMFFNKKGFASHYFLESGDDDLFINEAASKTNTRVELSANSFTRSKPKTTFSDWFRQKKRHLTTYKHYTSKSIFELSKFSISQVLFYLTFILLLIAHYEPIIVSSVFLIRFIGQMFIFKKAGDRLGEKDLLLFSPLFELLLMFIYTALSISGTFGKKTQWKT